MYMNSCNNLWLSHSFNPSAQINSVTYTVLSDIAPICNYNYRSSSNFPVTISGNYTVSAPNNVQFTVYQDLVTQNNVIATYPLPASSGGVVYLQEGSSYFIGSPSGATKGFSVSFTGPMQMAM